MVKDKSTLTDEIVKKQYEELLHRGLPFLQIFPEMIQESNVAETFKIREKERNKSFTQDNLDSRSASVEEFRENLFLYCGINLSVFKLSVRTQAAFWFMLFNWIECNNYSITIGPQKRKILAAYYSRSDDPDSRSVQNIFRALTKCGLFVKCKKTDLICKTNKTYEITYRVPFIVSQQRINEKFIMMNNEIIQLKSELLRRSNNYLEEKKKENDYIPVESIESSIEHLFSNVMNKVSKRNIEALGKVSFSAKIDFSADGGLKIGEIEHIQHIESIQYEGVYTDNLDKIFNSVRLTKKQRELLKSNFLLLKEAYFLKGKKAFNLEYKKIGGLGKATSKALLASFENQS